MEEKENRIVSACQSAQEMREKAQEAFPSSGGGNDLDRTAGSFFLNDSEK